MTRGNRTDFGHRYHGVLAVVLGTCWAGGVEKVVLEHLLTTAAHQRCHVPRPVRGVAVGALKDLGQIVTTELEHFLPGHIPIHGKIVFCGPGRRVM